MEQQIPLGVTPVQVVDSLPPMPAVVGTFDTTICGQPATVQVTAIGYKPPKAAKKPNPTGLSRAEIRLLADAVNEADAWRGSITCHPDPHVVLEFDEKIAKMKAAIRKLRAAAGVR